LGVCQELERVHHVGEVHLHFVILTRHQYQFVSVKFVCHKLRLLGETHHESEAKHLVIVCFWVPEQASESFGRFFVVSKLLLLIFAL
jgi:hypothetical protein